jgi:hypothetical protein
MYDNEITELDAAFLISPLTPKYNYSRLTRDEMYAMLPMKYKPTDKYRFVLAEAKHHINTQKIKQKLEQFHKILQLFAFANTLITDPDMDVSTYSPEFIKTVKHHPYLANMDNEGCTLYFGAAYWDSGLLDKFQRMIAEYKKLTADFIGAPFERKVSIYRSLCKLESNWFPLNNPMLPHKYIAKMERITSIYNQVEFILPSGHRFHVPVEKEPD